MTDKTTKYNRDVLRDPLIADKAIIALICIRMERPHGKTGLGPNRDDYPLFSRLIQYWTAGYNGEKDLLYRCRNRVLKYARQLSRSAYHTTIMDGDIDREDMLDKHRAAMVRFCAERELRELLVKTEEHNYGTW